MVGEKLNPPACYLGKICKFRHTGSFRQNFLNDQYKTASSSAFYIKSLTKTKHLSDIIKIPCYSTFSTSW